MAVEKQTGPLPGESIPLGDRANIVYMGTLSTYGQLKAVTF